SPGRATGPISPIAMQGSKTAGRGTVLPSAAAPRPEPTEAGSGPWAPGRPAPAGPERPGWQRTAPEDRPSLADRTAPALTRPGDRPRLPEPPRAPEPERPAPLRIQPPGAAPTTPAVRIAADPPAPRIPEPRAAEARPVDPTSAGGRPSGAGRADERRSPPPAPVIVLPPGRSPPNARPTDPGRRELDRSSDAGMDRSSAWDDPADGNLSWGPMPEPDGEDLLPDPQSAPARPTANPLIDAPEDNGPVARLISKALAAISGDSYVMLLIIGAAAITVLALVLLVVK
ncbi:MAG: hypothetical protein JNM72_04795, partial [Deltaproteobacteria bacterium]|nr:hypothetical protein [Deltaproteobacteria bacterium]